MDSIAQSLCKTTFLAALCTEQCTALSKVVRSRKLRAHESLFKMGDSGDYLAILITGQLSVKMTDGAPMAAIYPGEVVGEMACVDPAPRSANVVATKESTVVEISRTILGALQLKAPKIAVGIVGEVINLLARRVRDTNDRIESEMAVRGIKTALASPPNSISAPQVSKGANADGRIDLRTVSCLQAFKQNELKTLVKVAPPKSYPAGNLLCREGDPGNSCFILVHGQVEILRKMNGNTRVLATLDKGAMVGQMSLVDGAPRSATVRAVDECVVMELERVVFERLLQASNTVAMQFQDQIAVAGIRQLRMANQRLANLLLRKPAKARPRPQQSAQRTQPPVEREHTATSPINVELDDNGVALAYMQTALKEWGMSMHELDQVEVGQPIGMISQQELRARKLR